MTIHGPKPLHTDEASFEVGRTLVALQRRIRDDLIAAQSDGKIERPVLGALICLKAILVAEPSYDFQVHRDDITEWRDQYVEWFKANRSKFRKLRAAQKDEAVDNAVQLFNEVLELAGSTAYRLDTT